MVPVYPWTSSTNPKVCKRKQPRSKKNQPVYLGRSSSSWLLTFKINLKKGNRLSENTLMKRKKQGFYQKNYSQTSCTHMWARNYASNLKNWAKYNYFFSKKKKLLTWSFTANHLTFQFSQKKNPWSESLWCASCFSVSLLINVQTNYFSFNFSKGQKTNIWTMWSK